MCGIKVFIRVRSHFKWHLAAMAPLYGPKAPLLAALYPLLAWKKLYFGRKWPKMADICPKMPHFQRILQHFGEKSEYFGEK